MRGRTATYTRVGGGASGDAGLAQLDGARAPPVNTVLERDTSFAVSVLFNIHRPPPARTPPGKPSANHAVTRNWAGGRVARQSRGDVCYARDCVRDCRRRFLKSPIARALAGPPTCTAALPRRRPVDDPHEGHVKVMLAYGHTLSNPMAMRASGPSLLVIEKQHSPWEQQQPALRSFVTIKQYLHELSRPPPRRPWKSCGANDWHEVLLLRDVEMGQAA